MQPKANLHRVKTRLPAKRRQAPIRRQPRGVWVIAHAAAQRGKERQLRGLLRNMVDPTHAEQGCLIYDLYETEKAGKFYFYELWATRRDLRRHASSLHFQRMQEALPEFAAGPMEVILLKSIR
ncbi:MAG TPA: putative quinol monooxygenase [Candidatus Methylacidiphilales bacterium]